MAIVKMKRLRLAAMRDDQEELLKLLQRMGCVEIDEPSDSSDDVILTSLNRPNAGQLSALRERKAGIDKALNALKLYAPKQGGMFQPLPRVSEQEFFNEDTAENAQAAADAINEAERHINEIHANTSKITAQQAALTPWLGLDLPLAGSPSSSISVQLGTLPSSCSIQEVERAILDASDLAQLSVVSSDRELYYCCLVCHASQTDEIAGVLKTRSWSQVNFKSLTGTAKESVAQLNAQLEQLHQDEKEWLEKLAQMNRSQTALGQLSDRLNSEISLEENKLHLRDTDQVFFLAGWIPAEKWPELTKALAPYTCAADVSDPREKDIPNVPVKLKNNWLSRPLNFVTNMYVLPAYDGVDPNPLMAPFFIVFFGLMMADMAYGLLMVIGAIFMIKKMRVRGGALECAWLLGLCGVSTFIWGALTGGFFGDFIPQLLKIVNPESTFALPALFSPLTDTLMILLGSLALGVLQVFTGMVISVVKKFIDGNWQDAIWDEFTWWAILGGLVLMFLNIGTINNFPVLLLIGAAMLVVGSMKGKKGLGKLTSLIGNVYNGVTGFFSDILSYARLMALMLAGSVIAQVFNTLGSVTGSVIIFIVVSFIGNALNFALNLLSCYVHDLRLQCLEFFGRFYKEGGKAFDPLAVNTKYVEIVESNS